MQNCRTLVSLAIIENRPLINQLGESEETLKDALHQIRMAYVSLEQRDNMTSESEEENSGPETT